MEMLRGSLVVQAKEILPLATVHTLGNLLTNVSLGRVAVSFTHTIKVSSTTFLDSYLQLLLLTACHMTLQQTFPS